MSNGRHSLYLFDMTWGTASGHSTASIRDRVWYHPPTWRIVLPLFSHSAERSPGDFWGCIVCTSGGMLKTINAWLVV
jgi:hypothetical protein